MGKAATSARFGTAEFTEALRKVGPAVDSFGDLCELFKKSPWVIKWAIDLQLDENAIPGAPNTNRAKARKLLRGKAKQIRRARNFGRRLVKFLVKFPTLDLDPTAPLTRKTADTIYALCVDLGELGRSGARLIFACAHMWHWLAGPLEYAPDTDSLAGKANFYAIRCAAAVCFLEVLAALSVATAGTALSSKKEEPSSAVSAAVKSLYFYLRTGRESASPVRRLFRSASLGTVSHGGIVAMNWHELAFQLGDQLLNAIRSAVIDREPVALLFSPVASAGEALAEVDLSDKWPVFAAKIARVPPVEDWTRIFLELQCELEVAASQKSPSDIADSGGAPFEPTDKERNIIEAVGHLDLTGAELAKAAGYTFNSDFRRRLSEMIKRGLLVKGPTGQKYRRPPSVSVTLSVTKPK